MKKQTIFMACLLLSNMYTSSLTASMPQEEEWSPTPTPSSAPETNNETGVVERKETKEGVSSLSIEGASSLSIPGENITSLIIGKLNLGRNLNELYDLQKKFSDQSQPHAWNPQFKAAYIHQAEERQKAAHANPMRNVPAPKKELEFIIEHKEELPQFTSSLQDEIATGIQVIIKDKTLTGNDLALLPTVRHLNIQSCLNVIGEGLSRLSHLRILNLFGCDIKGIASLPEVTHLTLNACRFSQECATALYRSHNLMVLDFSNCEPGLTPEDLAGLRERGVTIINRNL